MKYNYQENQNKFKLKTYQKLELIKEKGLFNKELPFPVVLKRSKLNRSELTAYINCSKNGLIPVKSFYSKKA